MTNSLATSREIVPEKHAGTHIDIKSLSGDMRTCLDQSGVTQDGRDMSWASDSRLVEAFGLSIKAHNGKKRRYGTKQRGIHECWIAHRLFNDPDVKAWLSHNKLDPVFGAYCGIIHDWLENFRELAEKRGEIFDLAPLMKKAYEIWNNPDDNWAIRGCLNYTTDKPGLRGKTRLLTQWLKSIDQFGHWIINSLLQGLRTYDKLSHVVLDANECMLGNISETQALTCFIQAIRKAWVLGTPVGKKVTREYLAAMVVIRKAMSPKAQKWLMTPQKQEAIQSFLPDHVSVSQLFDDDNKVASAQQKKGFKQAVSALCRGAWRSRPVEWGRQGAIALARAATGFVL